MKKHDIKYIIKRVIIGVLIVLIVGSINKCNVYAVQLNSVNFNISAHGSGSCPNWYQINHACEIKTTLFSDTNIFGTYPVDFRVFSESTFSHPNTRYAKFKITNIDDSNTIFANFVFFNKTNQDLILDSINLEPVYRNGVFANLFILNSVSHVNGSSDSIESANNWGYYLYVYSNSNYDENVFLSNYFNNSLRTFTVSTTVPTNENILYLYHGAQNSISNNLYPIEKFFTDWEIYDTNLDLFYYDDTEIFPNLSLIPDYFSEIDITDYNSVYFVPKNYSNVDTILNSKNQSVIPFKYYYSGNITEGYFPLNDFEKITFFYYPYNNNFNSVSYVSSWFPLVQTFEGTDYDYNAFIIENNNFEVPLYSDKKTLIYYDSRYFDYYLVKDMSDYSEIISIINKNNESENINIVITNSMRELWIQGYQDANGLSGSLGNYISNAWVNSSLSSFFEIIRLPFVMLYNFTQTTCEPISISIPFVNGTITLPCVSGVLNDKLHDVYLVIKIVINGLVIYRVLIFNVETVIRALRPNDSRLEVVDL